MDWKTKYVARKYLGDGVSQPWYCDRNVVDAAINELEGRMIGSRIIRGDHKFRSNYAKWIDMWFAEYDFPRSPIKVALVGENGFGRCSGSKITIRLFDCHFEDETFKELSKKLKEIVRKYPER